MEPTNPTNHPEQSSDIENKIQIILRQTDYDETTAREKLHSFQNNEIKVIKDYLGIQDVKEQKQTSVNQTIYKELRHYLNNVMSGYHERVEKGEVKKVI